MKTTSRTKASENKRDVLRPEYRFDYARAKPNRFADQAQPGAVAVLLDPDVAVVFQDAKSVNSVLRALLTTMPKPRVRKGR
jgi:hypothetical protein